MREALRALRHMFGPDTPAPRAHLASNWTYDKDARGAYPYWPVRARAVWGGHAAAPPPPPRAAPAPAVAAVLLSSAGLAHPALPCLPHPALPCSHRSACP